MSINWLEFWYMAAREELGIRLLASNAFDAKDALYAARAQSGDEELNSFVVVIPIAGGRELWIIRESALAGKRRSIIAQEEK